MNGVKIAEKQIDSHILGRVQIIEANYYQKCAVWRDQNGKLWRMGLPMLELKGIDVVGEISGSEDPQALRQAGIVREVISSAYLNI